MCNELAHDEVHADHLRRKGGSKEEVNETIYIPTKIQGQAPKCRKMNVKNGEPLLLQNVKTQKGKTQEEVEEAKKIDEGPN